MWKHNGKQFLIFPILTTSSEFNENKAKPRANTLKYYQKYS